MRVKQHRLSADKRRDAILKAVGEIFVEKGFHATTTKDLAGAAGVSEALLYKHFPSKDSLYSAMCEDCKKRPAFIEYSRIIALESSTQTLVLLVHFFMTHFVFKAGTLDRLMARSLIEDGKFVRMVLQQFSAQWERKFEECLRYAARNGELRHTRVRPGLCSWFTQHTAMCLMLHLQSKSPALNYRVSKRALVREAVWFALLGAGLKAEAIGRYYKPEKMTLQHTESTE